MNNDQRDVSHSPRATYDSYSGRTYAPAVLDIRDQAYVRNQFERSHPKERYEFARTVALAKLNGVRL